MYTKDNFSVCYRLPFFALNVLVACTLPLQFVNLPSIAYVLLLSIFSLCFLYFCALVVVFVFDGKWSDCNKSVLSCSKALVIHSIIFVLMTTYFVLQAQKQKQQQLDFSYAKQSFLVEVKVVNFPRYTQINTPKNVKINTQRRDLPLVAIDFRLVKPVYNEKGEKVLNKGSLIKLKCFHCDKFFELGENWSINAKLKPPKGTASWGAFDYEKYAFANNIVASGYFFSKNAKLVSLEKTWLAKLRLGLRNILVRYLSDNSGKSISNKSKGNKNVNDESYVLEPILESTLKENAQSNGKVAVEDAENVGANLGLMQALIIGDRSLLKSEHWRLFRETGTSHLIAISGLHITLVFFLVSICLRKCIALLFVILPARMGRVVMDVCFTHFSIQALAMFGGLFIALLYALAAGFSLPTQRAILMLSVFCFCSAIGKRISLFESLCITIIILLLLMPLSTLHTGFWLSCSALLGIVLLIKSREVGWLMQCRMALLMLPITLLVFNQVALVSPLANMVFIPFIGVVLLPFTLVLIVLSWFSSVFDASALSLLDSLSFSALLQAVVEHGWLLLDGLLEVVWYGLRYFSTMQTGFLGQLPSISISAVQVVCLVILACMIMLWRLVIFRFMLLVPVLLSLFLDHSPVLERGEFSVITLDVGQGLATLIETRERFIVYDTGNAFVESDSAQSVIIPYLRRHPHKSVDTIIVSHADKDHIGGLDSLLELKTKKRPTLLLNRPQNFVDKNTLPQRCYSKRWQVDGVSFEVLDEIDVEISAFKKRNNASCVLKVSSSYGSALLPGDIERIAEHYLVKKYKDFLDVDLLIAAHHGSKTSSTSVFLNAVRPNYAIISAGFFSPYGHPHPTAVETLNKYSQNVLSTGLSGTIKINYLKDAIQAREYRALHRRFWYSEPLD